MTTTIEQIRNDLKTLRLYYSAQAQLDKAFTFIPHCTTELVKTYSEMIGRAPLELYMLYMEHTSTAARRNPQRNRWDIVRSISA